LFTCAAGDAFVRGLFTSLPLARCRFLLGAFLIWIGGGLTRCFFWRRPPADDRSHGPASAAHVAGAALDLAGTLCERFCGSPRRVVRAGVLACASAGRFSDSNGLATRAVGAATQRSRLGNIRPCSLWHAIRDVACDRARVVPRAGLLLGPSLTMADIVGGPRLVDRALPSFATLRRHAFRVPVFSERVAYPVYSHAWAIQSFRANDKSCVSDVDAVTLIYLVRYDRDDAVALEQARREAGAEGPWRAA